MVLASPSSPTPDDAGVGAVEAGDDVEERGLAGARLAEDGDQLARARRRGRSPSKSGAPPGQDLARPRTSSMEGARSEPGDDAEDDAAERGGARAPEQPVLLREHGDRGERDGDLQQRHRDREVLVRVQRVLALLVEAPSTPPRASRASFSMSFFSFA